MVRKMVREVVLERCLVDIQLILDTWSEDKIKSVRVDEALMLCWVLGAVY